MAAPMGATYIPGLDDYDYMVQEPVDVVSPKPQRQIQERLESLELDSREIPRPTPAPQAQLQGQYPQQLPQQQQQQHQQQSIPQQGQQQQGQQQQGQQLQVQQQYGQGMTAGAGYGQQYPQQGMMGGGGGGLQSQNQQYQQQPVVQTKQYQQPNQQSNQQQGTAGGEAGGQSFHQQQQYQQQPVIQQSQQQQAQYQQQQGQQPQYQQQQTQQQYQQLQPQARPSVPTPQPQQELLPKPSPVIESVSPPQPDTPVFQPAAGAPEQPNFSPFPRIQNRTTNVPPTHEEREATLEDARLSVLTSSDAEMQLYWAEDALIYAEGCVGYAQHTGQFGTARPSTPPTERQIRSDAVNVTTFLADQGHPKADFLRGVWLEFGRFGHAQNKPEAFRAYKRAASKGYARAEYRMGLQYESTNEPMKALQHYKAGEAQGDSASSYRVGMMSLLGQLGQTQDFANGVRLVQYAADTADENAPQGAYVFGMMLSGDLAQVKIPEQFLAINQAKAKLYIEKAAFLGFAKAQLKMGNAYELCSLGCPFDPTLALHYMALAARQGEPEAEMAISKWFLCGYENLFKKNNELAYMYAQRAAAGGLDTGEFAMGYFHEVGIHVPVDISQAREWYEKAAQHGNKDAPGRLSALAAQQRFTKSDHEAVALNRIRSQYGSRRGSRPERLQQPMQNLQSISEQGNAALNPQQQGRPFTTPRPPDQFSNPPPQQSRPFTTPRPPDQSLGTPQPPQGRVTPYPVDDRPLNTTPYPVEDERYKPRVHARTNGAFFLADERPPPANGGGQIPPMPYRAGLGPGPMNGPPSGPYRLNGPQGRPVALASNPNMRPPPNQRMQQGPQNNFRPPDRTDSAPPGGPQRRSYERPGQSGLAPNPTRPNGPPQQQQQQLSTVPPRRTGASPAPPPQTMDIGFSAPVDPRADQRNRYQGPSGVRPGPMQTSSSPAPSRPGGPSMPSRQPIAAPYSRPNGTSTPLSAPTPPPPVPEPGAGMSSGKPSKTGPQTFEEMGVPMKKNDHDCVMM